MRLRRVLSIVGVGLGMALPTGALPAEAVPGPSDSVSALSVDYDITADGVVRVTETIDYKSSPHGSYLTRVFNIREPYRADPERDQVWEYSRFTASSPSGAPVGVRITERDPLKEDGDGHDSRFAELSVHFPSLDGPARTIRYVLGYEVRGALVSGSTGAELRDWPVAIGRPIGINRIDVRVTIPSGVRTLNCRSHDTQCTTRVTPDGAGQVTAGRLDGYGDELLISVGAPAGAVRDAGPILADPPSWLDKLGVGGVAAALLAVAVLLVPATVRRTGTRQAARTSSGPAPDRAPDLKPVVARTGWARIGLGVGCAVGGLLAGAVAGSLAAAAGVRLGSALSGGLGAFGLLLGSGMLVSVVWVLWLCVRTGLGAVFGGIAALLVGVGVAGSLFESGLLIVLLAAAALVLFGWLTDPGHDTDPGRV